MSTTMSGRRAQGKSRGEGVERKRRKKGGGLCVKLGVDVVRMTSETLECRRKPSYLQGCVWSSSGSGAL